MLFLPELPCANQLILSPQQGAQTGGVVIALDRQERGKGDLSAIQEVERDYGIPVAAIVRLENLVEYLQADKANSEYLEKIQQYRDQYGSA